MDVSNGFEWDYQVIKNVSISIGHQQTYVMGYDYLLDSYDNGERELSLSFNSHSIPKADLADTLIMLAEEIRYQLN